MCLTMYLGVDKPQDSIPWDRRHPGFHVRIARWSKRKPLQRILGKPLIYEIGSHTGCGCGFLSDGCADEDEDNRRSSVAALVLYLAAAAASGEVELLACWIGEEKKEAQSLSLTPAAVADLDLNVTWDRPLRISLQAHE